jgi:endonuclease IV
MLMKLDKKNLINAINKSVKELHQGIDMHRYLVASVLEQSVDERNLQTLLNFYPSRSHEAKLKEAIKETIEVLEETRKAFKSKRLEALRKKLTQVLINAE